MEIQQTSYLADMKATIDIPDDLYRRIKAKSALQGRPIRAVAVELFQRWLDDEPLMGNRLCEPDPSAHARERSPEEWLEDWLRLGEEFSRNALPGPSAREILEQDRDRLEGRCADSYDRSLPR